MAEITIEVDDKGNIGTLPDPVQKFLDAKINDAFKRGASKVEADMKDKLADPAMLERLKLLEDESLRAKEDKAKSEKNWEEAERLKEERHAKALEERDAQLKEKDGQLSLREQRLRTMLGSEVRAAATAAGARPESLPELVKLLGADLDLDPATLDPFVKGADGKALEKDGKAVTIEGFVTEYLAAHPHHLAPARGRGGKAQGGASMRGAQGTGDPVRDAAFQALEESPTTKHVADAVGAMRQRANATH